MKGKINLDKLTALMAEQHASELLGMLGAMAVLTDGMKTKEGRQMLIDGILEELKPHATKAGYLRIYDKLKSNVINDDGTIKKPTKKTA